MPNALSVAEHKGEAEGGGATDRPMATVYNSNTHTHTPPTIEIKLNKIYTYVKRTKKKETDPSVLRLWNEKEAAAAGYLEIFHGQMSHILSACRSRKNVLSLSSFVSSLLELRIR